MSAEKTRVWYGPGTPTHFNGTTYSSRLHARWAMFFTALGLKFDYEPKWFRLPTGDYYKPNFRVESPTGLLFWYEVRSEEPADQSKLHAFNNMDVEDGPVGELLVGDPFNFLTGLKDGGVCPRCGRIARRFEHGLSVDADCVVVGCQPCDFDTPSGGYNIEEEGVTVPSSPHKGLLIVSAKNWDKHEKIVFGAAGSASGARFSTQQEAA